MNTLFHLAFPVHDFAKAKEFYRDTLGCELGRESDHALIFRLGSHQLVAHKIDGPLPEQEGIYPRHFGLIFLEQSEFDTFIAHINSKQVIYEVPPKTRYAKTRLEHQSFFLKDPSNNLLEFKYYTYSSAIFGEKDQHKVGEA